MLEHHLHWDDSQNFVGVLPSSASSSSSSMSSSASSEYVLLKLSELMEIRHFIYVRRALMPHIDGVTAAVEATGLGGVVGNKVSDRCSAQTISVAAPPSCMIHPRICVASCV